MAERQNIAYEAAVMHYVQGETMESIARRLGISRSTVSRMVKKLAMRVMCRLLCTRPRNLPII